MKKYLITIFLFGLISNCSNSKVMQSKDIMDYSDNALYEKDLDKSWSDEKREDAIMLSQEEFISKYGHK